MAWLFFWPYQFPWYDTMIICLLVFYPATRLDWLVLARVAAGTIPNTPGNPTATRSATSSTCCTTCEHRARAAGAARRRGGLVVLALLDRAWKLREPGEPARAPQPEARTAYRASAADSDRPARCQLTPQSAGVGTAQRAGADGLQHDRGDDRVGRQLAVADPLAGADRLDRAR